MVSRQKDWLNPPIRPKYYMMKNASNSSRIAVTARHGDHSRPTILNVCVRATKGGYLDPEQPSATYSLCLFMTATMCMLARTAT